MADSRNPADEEKGRSPEYTISDEAEVTYGQVVQSQDEDLEDYDPEADESMEVIDTRPGRPIPRGRWGDRPMPLARMTSTFVAPHDNWPVSLEVIVLSTNPRPGERTASREDLPELQLAGWEEHELGPLAIYLRVVSA